MKLFKIMSIVLILITISCFNDFEGTSLSFQEIKKTDDKFLTFSVKFKANKNINIEENYGLFCPLVTNDYSNENTIKEKYVFNSYLMDSSITNDSTLHFTDASFYEQDTTGVHGSDYLEKEKILKILNTKTDCIECRVFQIRYMSRKGFYHSKPFCIPKDSILKELKN